MQKSNEFFKLSVATHWADSEFDRTYFLLVSLYFSFRQQRSDMHIVALVPPQQLALQGTKIERVSTFKLLGVHITNDLKWEKHVQAICKQAASRIHFLKQLKRSAASPGDLIYFYTAVIRPVLEYACVVSSLAFRLRRIPNRCPGSATEESTSCYLPRDPVSSRLVSSWFGNTGHS